MNNRFEGIVVVDNVTNDQYQEYLNTLFLEKSIPWSFCKEISGDITANIKTIGFSHQMYLDNAITSSTYLTVLPLLLAGCSAAKIKFIDIIRSTSFLIPPTPHLPEYTHETPHVNLGCDHIVGLYYINDSDGDTVFFDKKLDTMNPEDPSIPKEIYRVTPKMGRMVFFDGAIYHASTKPKENVRCVLTFDFIGNLITQS